jgi:hypothetical protein
VEAKELTAQKNLTGSRRIPICSLLRFAVFLQHVSAKHTIAACQKYFCSIETRKITNLVLDNRHQHPCFLTTNLARRSLVSADQTSMDPFPLAHGLPRDQCHKESFEERVNTRRYGEGRRTEARVLLSKSHNNMVVRRECKKYTGTVSLKIQGYLKQHALSDTFTSAVDFTQPSGN